MAETVSLEEHRKREAATAEEDALEAPVGSRNGNGAESHDDGASAQSLDDIEGGEAATGEEPDGQVFILEQGKQVGLAALYKRGTPVKFEMQLTGKTLKGPGNLVPFSDPDVMLVVPARAGKVETDPTYNDDGSIKSVTIRQRLKATTFYDSRTEAARVALDGE